MYERVQGRALCMITALAARARPRTCTADNELAARNGNCGPRVFFRFVSKQTAPSPSAAPRGHVRL